MPLRQGSYHTHQPVEVGYSRVQPQTSKAAEQPIMVFPFDLTGTGVETWPAVGLSLAEFEPRETNYQWRDPIRRDVPGTDRTVRVWGGDVVRANLQTVREHPRPFNLGFHVRIDARNETELALMTERVYSLLDTKGYIEVELRSGEKVTYDTQLLAPIAPRKDTTTLEGNGAGAYTFRLLYRVEAYMDNSEATELMRLITRATLNSNGRDGSLAHEVLDPEVPQLSETGLLLVEDGSVFLVENGAYMKLG